MANRGNQFKAGRRFFLVLMLIVGIWPGGLLAEKTEPVKVEDDFKELRLDGESVWVLRDPDQTFQLVEVMAWYKDGEGGTHHDFFGFGLEQSGYWMGFTIRNAGREKRELLVELINSYLNDFQFHRYDPVRDTLLSDVLRPEDGFLKRQFFINHQQKRSHQNFHFSFELEAGEETDCLIYFAPSKHAFKVRLLLWDAAYRFTVHNDYESIILHAFFMLCIIYLLILGFTIYIIEFPYYWYYFIYVVLGALFVYTDIGLAYRYWWPNRPEWQQIATPVLINLYLIAGVLFIRSYFQTRKHYPTTDRVLLAAVIVAALIIPLVLYTMVTTKLTYPHFLFKISNILYATTCLLFFLLLFRAIFHSKMYFSGLFLFGFSLHGLSVITSNLQFMQLLPGGSLATLLSGIGYPLTFNTHISLMLGMVLEMIVVFYIGIRRFAHIFKKSNEAIKDLAEQKEKNRNLLVMGIESERERIARDLHDDLSRLTVVKMKLNTMKEHPQAEEMAMQIEEIIEDVDTSHSELRGIARNLMPKALYDLGLLAAVEELIYRIKILEKEMDIQFYNNMSFEGTTRQAQLYLFRIVQELLNNVVKYAKASEANLQFIRHEEEQKMILTMEDDGIGFDLSSASKKGNGLKNIKYRVEVLNGSLHIDTVPDGGTLISAEIPFSALYTNGEG